MTTYITTTVRVDKDVLNEAKNQGIVISRFLNDALRASLNKNGAQKYEVIEEIKRLEACLTAQKEVLKHIDKEEIKKEQKDKAQEFDEIVTTLKQMYVKVIEGTDKGQFNTACKRVAKAYNMEFQQVVNRVVK